MVLKVWSFIIGGILIGLGAGKTIPDVFDKWEAIVLIGAMTLLIVGLQTLCDYGKPKGWWV